MKRISTARYLFFALLFCSIFLYWFNVTVFMDDVFIYLRVARNIADGAGPVFNAGDLHFPVTSPLWVFLLAFFHKLFAFINLVVLSKLLYMIFLALASWFAYLIFRDRADIWAAVTPFPIFFNYITLSSTGGEIALVYFAIFATLWAYTKKKNLFLTGLSIAIAYLSRGELAMLAFPIGLHYLYRALKEKKRLKEMTLDLGKISLGFLAVAMVWHTYYALQFHTLFPKTLTIKIVQGKSGMWNLYYRFGRIHSLAIIAGHYYLLVFLFFALYYYRFISFALLFYTVTHYYSYQFMTVPHYHWYYYDFYLLFPLLILLGIAGLIYFLTSHLEKVHWYARQQKKYPGHFRIASETAIVLLMVLAILVTTQLSSIGKYSTDQRQTRYMRVVEWFKPRLEKGDVLLAHEIGILGYYLEEAVIRDLNGIASPDVTVDNINDLGYFVTHYSPRFIFFPSWLPQKRKLKYVAVNRKLAVYEKGYTVWEKGRLMESVYIFKEMFKLVPYVRILESLRQNVSYYPNREYEILKHGKAYVLSAPAPFHSLLVLPAAATGVTVSFGLLSGGQNQKPGGDVTFKIYGIAHKSRRQLYKMALCGSASIDKTRAEISFKAGEFISLEFAVETGKKSTGPPNLKSYWGRVRFRYKQKR